MSDQFDPGYEGDEELDQLANRMIGGETTTIVLEKISLAGLRQEIVDNVASRMMSQLLSKMERRLDKEIMPAIQAAVESSIGSRIEAAMVAPVQPTDHYGNPKGAPVTIAEMAEKATKDWLGQRADNGYGSRSAASNLEAAISRVAGSTVEKIAASAVGEAMTKLKEDLATAATKEMGTAVLRLLGMKA